MRKQRRMRNDTTSNAGESIKVRERKRERENRFTYIEKNGKERNSFCCYALMRFHVFIERNEEEETDCEREDECES
jgi:hypothetical protein